MRLPDSRKLPCIAAAVLVITLGANSIARAAEPAPANGPDADYPMEVGAPYTIGSTSFTPVDTMNYDAVGYATVSADSKGGITAAHHTLPVPSYVEVTSLDSGKTILVRLERRGPMDSTDLIALSPGAAAQLGLGGSGKSAVRVRRVNPPESERALLRAGQEAPARMSTPKPLLAVLQRKLTPDASVQLARESSDDHAPTATAPPTASPPVNNLPVNLHKPVPVPVMTASADRPAPNLASPASSAAPHPHIEPHLAKTSKPTPVAPPSAPSTTPIASETSKTGAFVVQAGAYGVKANAVAVANKIGAKVEPQGKIWRVRMGPFTNRTSAAAALAKARAAGYSQSRIQPAD